MLIPRTSAKQKYNNESKTDKGKEEGKALNLSPRLLHCLGVLSEFAATLVTSFPI